MKAELLRQAILSQYGSIRKFALTIGVPPSTLQSAIENDTIGKMAVDTVILICDNLGLDVRTLEPLNKTENNLVELDRFSKQVVEQTKEAVEAMEQLRKKLDEEVKKIINSERTRYHSYNQFLILFAIGTGLRQGEILGLTYGDIENGKVKVVKKWLNNA